MRRRSFAGMVFAVSVLSMGVGGTGAAPAAEPVEKSRLVFVNGSRIFAINADGSGRKPLTSHPKPDFGFDEIFDGAPRVSPDGDRVLFLRNVDYDEGDEFTQLMVASMDGTGARKVISTERLTPKKRLAPDVELNSATWSQDGERIVFSQTDSNYWFHRAKWKSRIRSVKPDGSGLKTIRTSRLKRSRGKGYRGPGVFGDIDVSGSDGRMLVTRERIPGGRSDLIMIDPLSGKTKTLVRSANEGRWSPDGASILFLSDRDRTGEQCYEGGCDFQVKLYTAESDGSGQRRVENGKRSGTIFGADWSPDGSRIAFGSDRNMPGILGLSMEVYSVQPDGSCLTWLTNGSPESWDPDWSPVAGTDSSPGACGTTERPVTVDPLPSPKLFADDLPTSLPRLWAGPVYRDRVLTLPTVEGDDLTYFDCANFRRSDCDFVYYSLESREICDRGVSDFLEAGRYRGLVRHRGALLSKPLPNWDGNREVTLITGGQTVTIQVEDIRANKPTTFVEYLELVDELRPVGRDDLIGADLKEAVFDRGDITRAAQITRTHARLKSVRKTAKRFRTKPKVIRANLRFQRDLEKLGPVKTKRCPA